ncbi:MAG: Clp protease ClpP [Clostridia bacterium]|nr:Clp protease ClpP [Clostridia bacterium]
MSKTKIDIKRSAYAMASVDGNSAEITMYGDIYETQPVDWWTGEPIEGQYILLTDFMADLEQISHCAEITIRMNSYGGDAGVSNTIHNRLRDLARDGAHLTCIVDGVAMSGGSLIMCACDTVRANPSSLIMIHKCWMMLWGGYNADELREQATQQDAWDKMQIEIYQRKTGLSETVISHMMSDTTYMTGREAMEKGFVDELIEDAEPLSIAASADGRCLICGGRTLHLAPGMFAPDNIPTVAPEDNPSATNTNQPAETGSQEGGNQSMANTLEELRAEYPELTAQLEAEARDSANAANAGSVEAERQRIQEIDALASLYDAETVREAKYGENPCTAQELAYRAAQEAAKKGQKFLNNLDEDAKASGTAKVGAAAAPDDQGEGNLTPEQLMAKGREAAKAVTGKEDK